MSHSRPTLTLSQLLKLLIAVGVIVGAGFGVYSLGKSAAEKRSPGETLAKSAGKPRPKPPTPPAPKPKPKERPDWVNKDDLKKLVEKARELCQQAKWQEVIDSLAEFDHPEANYLKAIAFHSMSAKQDRNRHNLAYEYAKKAETAEPDNVKYVGARMCMLLGIRDKRPRDLPQQIVDLERKNPTVGGLGYFAYFAYQAVLAETGKKIRLAIRAKDAKKIAAFKKIAEDLVHNANICFHNAVELAASTPELQRRMLFVALARKMAKPANSLAARLRKAAPNDARLADQAIQAQILVNPGSVAENVDVASLTEKRAVFVAEALTKAGPAPARAELYQKIVHKFPTSRIIRLGYAIYLAKERKWDEAVATLEQGITYQEKPADARQLTERMIYLVLEGGNAPKAGELLKKHRRRLDALMAKYFEARILVRSQKTKEGLAMYASLMKDLQGLDPPNRALQLDILGRVRQIWQQAKADEAIRKAAKAIEDTNKTPMPKPPMPKP